VLTCERELRFNLTYFYRLLLLRYTRDPLRGMLLLSRVRVCVASDLQPNGSGEYHNLRVVDCRINCLLPILRPEAGCGISFRGSLITKRQIGA
jgi:hypothetical protein